MSSNTAPSPEQPRIKLLSRGKSGTRAPPDLPATDFGPGNKNLSMTGYAKETGNMVLGDGSAKQIKGNKELETIMNEHLQATEEGGSNMPRRNMTFLRPSQIP